jgi:hypothetical protein
MRCKKKKLDGKQCRARALSGGKFCALHADPGKAAELGSKGGRRRAGTKPAEHEAPVSVDPPKTAQQLRDLLAEVVASVRMHKLDARTANALAYTGTALLRVIEVSDLESRLAALEVRLQRSGHNDSNSFS